MPFSFALAAMRLPTSSAALRFAPCLSWLRNSFSALEAAASTWSPAGVVHHRMREAEREIQLVTLRLRAEADAHQREALLEALGDAEHHVRDQRAHGPGHGVRVVRIAQRLEQHLLAVLLHFDVRIGGARDAAERSFHRDAAGGKRDLDALRQGYGIFSDAGHG